MTGEPSDPPARTPLALAGRSLLGVLHNRDIRSLELAWTLGVAADWALLVVALLVAYDEGGAVLVGLVSLTRMIPATVVNVVIDTSAFPRPERALIGANLVRAAGAVVVAAASLADATALVFVAVAAASAAGALVRPTVLTLLPAVATSPAELVSANTAGALGESLGTFAGPLVAGLVIAQGGAAPAAVVSGVLCLVAAGVAAAVRVPDASRLRDRERRASIPLVAGVRELVARPPAGMVMVSFIAQTAVRGALTTFLAILAIEVLGMGDAGVGVLGAAIGLGGIAGALGALAIGADRRLAVVFAIALVLWGAPIAVIGFVPVTVVALLALGVVGVGNALIDVSGLTLLQRGTSNRARSAVFAVLEVVASASVSIGAIVASLLIGTLGIERALVLVGLSLPVVAVLGWPLVRRLDTEGVVPERQASLLRGIPLFAMLPLAALERVATGMREVRFAAGERLMSQGEEGDTFVVIERGDVEVAMDGQPHHREGAGAGIGEIALLRAIPRTATVTAVDDVDAWSIDCETFLDAVTGHEGSAAAAHAVVESRLREG
ncbi:MAG TPA: cyclic nucleotide-binding domain-containing protein [Candidatus Limnocylindrales bacterium]